MTGIASLNPSYTRRDFMAEFAIGARGALIRGGGRYIDDVALPGTIYVVVLRLPYARV